MKLMNFLNNWSQTVAMEAADVKEQKETEVVVYAKVGEPARLEECASYEDHVQLETKFQNGTRCRVRKTTKDTKDAYHFTFKIPTVSDDKSGMESNQEVTVEVDEDFFKAFLQVAERKLVKRRYNFTSENVTLTVQDQGQDRDIVIPNIQYEVDIYTKEDGQVSEWCKIDVEVDNIITYIESNHKEIGDIKLMVKVSQLPFAPSSTILAMNATDEQRIKIDEIWKEFSQSTVQNAQP